MLGAILGEGVPLYLLHFKRRHKGSALINAARPLRSWNLVEPASRHGQFQRILLGTRNAL
jgi:hypothetical protein